MQIRLNDSYFAAFLVNRTTIDLQNRQNLPSFSQVFAWISQVRQAPGVRGHNRDAKLNSHPVDLGAYTGNSPYIIDKHRFSDQIKSSSIRL